MRILIVVYMPGVELDEPHGKNDGSVQGVSYFRCPSNHGIFVRKDIATKLSKLQAAAAGETRAPAATSILGPEEGACQGSSGRETSPKKPSSPKKRRQRSETSGAKTHAWEEAGQAMSVRAAGPSAEETDQAQVRRAQHLSNFFAGSEDQRSQIIPTRAQQQDSPSTPLHLKTTSAKPPHQLVRFCAKPIPGEGEGGVVLPFHPALHLKKLGLASPMASPQT